MNRFLFELEPLWSQKHTTNRNTSMFMKKHTHYCIISSRSRNQSPRPPLSTDDNLRKTQAPETEGVKMVLGSTEADKKTPELVAKSNKSKFRTQTSIKIICRLGQSTISRTLAPNLTAIKNTVQIINLSKKNITDAGQNLLEKG